MKHLHHQRTIHIHITPISSSVINGNKQKSKQCLSHKATAADAAQKAITPAQQ